MNTLFRAAILILAVACASRNTKDGTDYFEYDAGPDWSLCYGENYEPVDLNENALAPGQWEGPGIEIVAGLIDVNTLAPGSHQINYRIENEGTWYYDSLVIHMVDPLWTLIEEDTLLATIADLNKEIEEGRYKSVGLDFFDEDLKVGEYQVLQFVATHIEGCQKDIERVVYVKPEDQLELGG